MSNQTATTRVASALSAIASNNPAINAFVEVHAEHAEAIAARIDARRAAGEDVGPLAGLPVAIKDNIVLARGRTTCASRMLRDYRSPFSATAVERLEAAGAIVVGKTNLDEFGMGSSTERSIFGPTANPHDPARVPGGSSGGSAAAVASGLVAVALGSDTGGSIRQPASHCGVVGLKPTYGRVSRWGLVAYASSLDQIGPIGRTVRDVAGVYGVIAGFDPRDTTCAPTPVEDPLGDLEAPVTGLRIGVPRQAHSPANAPSVSATLHAACAALQGLGATIVDVDLPHADHAIAAYYLIATAEASSNLARFDGVRYGHRAELPPGSSLVDLYCRSRSEGFGPEVRKRILLGTHALSSGYYDAYYLRAQKVRRLVRQDHDRAFCTTDGGAGCHALLLPAAPGPAFRRGEKLNDPMALYLEDVYTVGVNLAGLPALTVPFGWAPTAETGAAAALPIGMQLVGPPLAEAALLRIGRMLEKARPAAG
ncbi:MAG: Asp-tRNA(Asn)/Glu-tRNA(Gln) amidotransferase subunit GatA [Phycisphaerales bacterium]